MQNLKIAVFHNLPSGGAKRALYGMVDFLVKSGHEVEAFVPSTANEKFLPLKNIVENVDIFPVKKSISGSIYSSIKYVPPFIKGISLRDLESTEKEIAENINRKDFDVVLCEQDQYTLSPFLLKYIKKPTAYYCQQPTRDEAILKKIGEMTEDQPNRFKRQIFNYADGKDLKIDKENASCAKYILANSYFSRESILRDYGLNSYVSYLGIDTNIFKQLTLPKEDFVLSVGTCTPSKGYDFIIKSLAMIEPNLRPKFVVVANHSLKDWKKYIVSLAKDLDVVLEILDMVDDEKLLSLYNRASLVLYAPYLEPFGLVPIESMGCGTPVIGVKEGGVRESVIHDETGLLVERDESLFAEAILKTLQDEDKLSKMSDSSVDLVQKFWTLEHAGQRISLHLKRAFSHYDL
jgi:glycosyltransferase involved in cell wall biosynthesis